MLIVKPLIYHNDAGGNLLILSLIFHANLINDLISQHCIAFAHGGRRKLFYDFLFMFMQAKKLRI